MRYIDTGSRDAAQSLAAWLQSMLTKSVAEVRLQSGFFNEEPLGLFAPTLERLAQTDGAVGVLIGSNAPGTQRNDVLRFVHLLGLPRQHARFGVVQYDNAFFHPKTYHFRRDDGSQCAYVGSANLTAPGVSSLHVEAGLTLDTRDGDPETVLNELADAVDAWFVENGPGLHAIISADDVAKLVTSGVLIDVPPAPPPSTPSIAVGGGATDTAIPVGPAAARLRPLANLPPLPAAVIPAAAVAAVQSYPSLFVMQLSPFDTSHRTGVKGTTEVLIPHAAVGFFPTVAHSGRSYPDVYFDVMLNCAAGQELRTYRLWYYEQRATGTRIDEYRLRLDKETIDQTQPGGGDIVVINRLGAGQEPAYEVTVVNRGQPDHARYAGMCDRTVQGKRWGLH